MRNDIETHPLLECETHARGVSCYKKYALYYALAKNFLFVNFINKGISNFARLTFYRDILLVFISADVA